MPRRRTDFRGLTNVNRLRQLDAIQSEPGLGLQAVSLRVGIAMTTAHDHRRALGTEDLVATTTAGTGSRGRPASDAWTMLPGYLTRPPPRLDTKAPQQ